MTDLVADGERLEMNGDVMRFQRDDQTYVILNVTGRTLPTVVKTVEAQVICTALENSGGNRKAAAEAIGLTYSTFRERLGHLSLKFQVSAA